jgi:hypothetical protein
MWKQVVLLFNGYFILFNNKIALETQIDIVEPIRSEPMNWFSTYWGFIQLGTSKYSWLNDE